ncbi:MAG: disulfide oxidoreductase [Proteobacteria bacterium]|nr:disulfide oxidoreductase [Pseudomonadota bacterium]
MQIDTSRTRPRIVAVLGPTNTGKTHLAMERMLGHASGMIGFPLRLLARENYDRAVVLKGRGQVALITGEEKIIPPGARYFLCTAESMPLDRETAFLGLDEIQMCADPDRGHIFTERLLGARGRDETMFLGAETIKPLIRRLVPEAEFDTRPRLSTLRYTGERKTGRLKPRTAVVAFSASEVYGLAELVRRQRGGAAVVLGALSPRTRNAQVAMYQDGEVDYLVATDAIGMGLNMDVDHVAFAGTSKFDGRARRPLTAAELAQTAGRAGRHMNDGTFGTTANIGPLDADTVARIENHHFEPLKFLYWRNPDLDFSSLAALQRSLTVPPRTPGLIKAREAGDEQALRHLARDPEIAARAATPAGLRLLWDVCRIPDFGKVMSDAHCRLLGAIHGHLAGPGGRLPKDWLAAQVTRLERTDGGIETLAARIAAIRTWTYVSHHPDWLDDAPGWQERTRAIEDKLSDALHRGLTQRFVDKRAAILVSRIKDRDQLLAAVDGSGEVIVEGHSVGRLEGFRFVADEEAGGLGDGAAAKAVSGAAERALRGEIASRLKILEADADEKFELTPDESGWPRRIAWRGAVVARLAAGPSLLKPAVEPLFTEFLDPPGRGRLQRRLRAWLDGHVADLMEPLPAALEAGVSAPVRGIVFQLAENLGSVGRDAVAPQIGALGKAGRKELRVLGVRLGRHRVFMPALLKAPAVAMRGLLWVVAQGSDAGSGAPPPSPPPSWGRVSLPMAPNAPDSPEGFYQAMGYVPFGALAVRADIAERIASKAWALGRKGAFELAGEAGPELMSLAGCGAADMAAILEGLGYRGRKDKGGVTRFRLASQPKPKKQEARRAEGPTGKQQDSPFAKLGGLTAAPPGK